MNARAPKLNLPQDVADECRELARDIAADVNAITDPRTTVSVERAALRLLGVEGDDADEVPLVNRVVDRLAERSLLEHGAGAALAAVVSAYGITPTAAAEAIADGRLTDGDAAAALGAEAGEALDRLAADAETRLREQRARRRDVRDGLAGPEGVRRYVLTATGDAYEDVAHAEAVAEAGGDIVAVIRSTAQSLLDYVPAGTTREGYGGTYATQANLRLMREALDEWSARNGRYVELSTFSSGLCMPEIAALAVIEGLDNIVNDALYGALYRDINPMRTLIDQRFSRTLSGAFAIRINTGEDNFLRSADALEAAGSVTASQFINHALARSCGLADADIAVGDAFEIATTVDNSLLLQWAQALLAVELFPGCPVKYMPPTKHMDGDALRTQAVDTLFNLVTAATRPGIQTVGVPSEGVLTPLIHDRVHGLDNARYVSTAARDLADEIEFRPGGIVQTRARRVLARAHELLLWIHERGLVAALEAGVFGDVSRAVDRGRGGEGVLTRSDHYRNPFWASAERREAVDVR